MPAKWPISRPEFERFLCFDLRYETTVGEMRALMASSPTSKSRHTNQPPSQLRLIMHHDVKLVHHSYIKMVLADLKSENVI
jgi:hypothetical protein